MKCYNNCGNCTCNATEEPNTEYNKLELILLELQHLRKMLVNDGEDQQLGLKRTFDDIQAAIRQLQRVHPDVNGAYGGVRAMIAHWIERNEETGEDIGEAHFVAYFQSALDTAKNEQ